MPFNDRAEDPYSTQEKEIPEESMINIIETKAAPDPIGPYSQAVRIDGLVFVSGQIPVEPTTGRVVEGGIAAQTHQVMKNLHAVLAAAGSGSLQR